MAIKLWKTRGCRRNNYSTRKKRWNIKRIKATVIIKMEHKKNIPTVKRFNYIKISDKKLIEVNNLSSDQNSVNKNIRFNT